MQTREILSAAPALTGQTSTTVLVDEKDLQNILDELLSALQMLQEAKRVLQAIKRDHRKMAKDLARIKQGATKTVLP